MIQELDRLDAFSSLPPASPDPWITLLPPASEAECPSVSPWASVNGAAPGPRTMPLPPPFAPLRTLPPIPAGALGPATELLPPAPLASIRPVDPWLSAPEPPPLFCYAERPPIMAEPPKGAPDEPEPPPASPRKATAPPPRPVGLPPLEQYARMQARIAHQPEQTNEILEKNGLDAPGFQALVHHWQSAIEAEIRQGKSSLRRAYDAAFIAELERARGPLTQADLVSIAVAFERDDLGNALTALHLPQAAALPIHRVYLSLALQAPKLRAAARAALS